MTAKVVAANIKLSIAEAFFRGLKDVNAGDTFYAAVTDIPIAFKDSDGSGNTVDIPAPFFEAYNTTRHTNNDSDEFYGGLDATEFDRSDKAFYLQNTYSMHKIYPGGISRVIPRVNWTRNTVYNNWPEEENSYVLTREIIAGVAKLNVFKCLFSPGTSSTEQPTGNSASEIYLPDGYVWKYMYTVSNADAIKFLTGNDWMPVVEKVDDDEVANLVPGTSRYDLYTVQANAQRGEIYTALYDDAALYNNYIVNQIDYDSETNENYSFVVEAYDLADNTPGQLFSMRINWIGNSPLSAGGSGYSTKTIIQKGTGYIGPLQIGIDSDNLFDFMQVDVSPGTGHGSDVPTEFNAANVMLVSRLLPDGDVLKVVGNNGYNMVMLIKNPLDAATNSVGENDLYISCKSLTISSPQGNLYRPGEFICKSTGGSGTDDDRLGYVVAIDGNTVYYTNPVPDRDGDSFTSDDVIDTANVTIGNDIDGNLSLNNITFSPTGRKALEIGETFGRETIFNTGSILIVDNKGEFITRSEDQIESFNFVFEF